MAFTAGRDLGRQRDPSGLALLEPRQHPAGWDPVDFCQLTRPNLCVSYPHCFPLGTPCPAVVASALGP
ncbi:MAG: hypothetical protein ACKV22_38220 [Bryobacteraceae bacterium]